MSQVLPPSTIDWTNFFALTFIIGFAAGTIVVGIMTYLAISNRSRKGKPEAKPWASLGRSPAREAVVFAAISGILLFSLAVGSYRLSYSAQHPPELSQALVIDVTAFQWDFRFNYPNNNNISSTHDCYVPTDQPIIFNVTSSDVMHNFGLSDFRLKIDAIPGRNNILWVTTPSFPRNYTAHCYELCGFGHTYMTANLVVLEPAAFNQWLNQTIAKQTTNSTMGGT